MPQSEKVSELIRRSAHLGMRGSFNLLQRFSGTSALEKLEFHCSGYEMIQQYSTRQLTKASDKLMAIVGVAALMQHNTRLIFVAGLWKHALVFNLLWSTNETEQRSDRPVPSWSWASVDGEIHDQLKPPEASSQRFSQMDLSDLRQAASKQIIPSRKLFEPPWHTISTHITIRSVFRTTVIDSITHNAQLRISCLLLERSVPDEVHFLPDVTSHVLIPTLWYMPIISFSMQNSEDGLNSRQTHGLVISSVEPTVFQRVGYFWTSDREMRRRLAAESEWQTILFI
jgi:hypothetical protein